MAENLWEKAEANLRAFNERYDEVHRYYDSDNVDALDKLLDQFAFRKNGTAPSFIGEDFHKWMNAAFRPMDIDDPEGVRPPGVLIMSVIKGDADISEFFILLDAYRDALQAVVNATAPVKFTYQGFAVENPQHLGDALSRHLLEGVDYVVALFKKRGLDKLLTNEVKRVELVPLLEDTTLGLYWSEAKKITLSAKLVGMGTGRFMKWVNEAFLHEFGHHVHLSYITGEARAVWDSGWAEVKEKEESIELAFKKITHAERVKFFDVLKTSDFDPSKAAKKLKGADKVKFGVWLRSPMTGPPLITDKQLRLTKEGQRVFQYFQTPIAYLKERYGLAIPSIPTPRILGKRSIVSRGRWPTSWAFFGRAPTRFPPLWSKN